MKAPLTVRFERRAEASRGTSVIVALIAALAALFITSLLLVISGNDPFSIFKEMWEAAFTNPGAFSATLQSATPLVFTGLAAAVALRLRVWNIGGEGQLYVGAIFAVAAGILIGPAGLAVALPATVAAGFLGGALWAAMPGLLRVYFNTNEILTSLLLNYVAGLGMFYLVFDSRSFWRDLTSPGADAYPQGKPIDAGAEWPGFIGADIVVPTGLLLGVASAAGLILVLRKSTVGFRWRVVADSPDTGHYAGMRTKHAFLSVMLLSGGLAGLAGASQVGDFSHLLDPPGLQQSAFGYTGIVVAALALYNPLGVVVAAVFLGGLVNAGLKLQGPDFPLGLVGAMQGIILFCVLGAAAFSRYRLRVHRRAGDHPGRLPVRVKPSAGQPQGGS
jgi:general nucleoside transport system permease protein